MSSSAAIQGDSEISVIGGSPLRRAHFDLPAVKADFPHGSDPRRCAEAGEPWRELYLDLTVAAERKDGY